MSYTLRGRLESRVAAAVLPFLVACAVALASQAWWPLELAGAMVAVGLSLDVGLYHRLLPYQPGWAAFPLGLLELAGTMGLLRLFEVGAPLEPALWFFAGSWLVAQLLGHGVLPLLRLTYAEEGGELGRAGVGLSLLAPAVALLVIGVAWTTQPPTVHLARGVHQGPLVLDFAQKLVGEDGAIVRGGIKVLADDIVVRNVTVVGGPNGIEVDDARDVVLDDVRVVGARLDGIHVRRSMVEITDCRIDSPSGYTQGIDISFAADLGMSLVEDCWVTGGQEGIVTHSANAMIRDNTVRRTTLRAITMTEMSMGEIEGNTVLQGLGVGIFCGDYSHCEIERNTVTGTRADRASGDASRLGIAVEAHYHAKADLHRNELAGNPVGVAAFADAEVHVP
jgi:parallel beta helix pectate lyase-like protein